VTGASLGERRSNSAFVVDTLETDGTVADVGTDRIWPDGKHDPTDQQRHALSRSVDSLGITDSCGVYETASRLSAFSLYVKPTSLRTDRA